MVRVDLKIPFVAPRSAPVIAYHISDGEDEIFVCTVNGQEHLVPKYMHMIGEKTVIPGCAINFFKISPKKDARGNIIGG